MRVPLWWWLLPGDCESWTVVVTADRVQILAEDLLLERIEVLKPGVHRNYSSSTCDHVKKGRWAQRRRARQNVSRLALAAPNPHLPT